MKLLLATFFIMLLVFSCSTPPTPPGPYEPGAGYQLVWSDEFSPGAISSENWNIEQLRPGYYNQELQEYVISPETAHISPQGELVMTAIRTDNRNTAGSYQSARLNTFGKRVFQYGKIVARIQLPYGMGIWPAFWMLGADFQGLGGQTAWPQCGEVDIMEFFGGKSLGDNKSLAALHGPGYSGDFPDREVYTNPSGDFKNGFHIFEIEWTENRITHSIDGHAFHTSSPAQVSGEWVFNKPFFLILNFAVGGFGYDPDASTVFPQSMLVDWVRVYQKAP